MDIKIAGELLDEIFSSLETLETKSAATLQFLTDRGQVTDEQIAPYLEQAGNASNVRWRATRLRIMSLLSAATKNAEEPAKKPEAFNEDKNRNEDTPKQDSVSETSELSNEESSPEPATASTRAESKPNGIRSAQQTKDQKKDRKEKVEDRKRPRLRALQRRRTRKTQRTRVRPEMVVLPGTSFIDVPST